MSSIAANFAAVQQRIATACAAADRGADSVQLLAVSKYTTTDAVREALAIGHVAFGESRVQSLAQKAAELQDAEKLQWHLIGTLQTNKVRDLLRVPHLTLLHSLDRMKLADALHRELAANDRRLSVLLQINATGEEQKHGCLPDDAATLLGHVQGACTTLDVQGLMAMGPREAEPRAVFDRVAELRDELQKGSGLTLSTLSLGMSGDLEDAIAAGSTMVRVGSALFGG